MIWPLSFFRNNICRLLLSGILFGGISAVWSVLIAFNPVRLFFEGELSYGIAAKKIPGYLLFFSGADFGVVVTVFTVGACAWIAYWICRKLNARVVRGILFALLTENILLCLYCYFTAVLYFRIGEIIVGFQSFRG